MDLAKAFIQELNTNEEFALAQDIARKNSFGKLWLVGGFIYRTLAKILHGTPRQHCDFDFLAEKVCEEYTLPEGWQTRPHDFAAPKIIGPFTIDLFPFTNLREVNRQGLEHTIESYHTCVPLNIQAVAYDLDEHTLIGHGIEAVQQRIVAINCLPNAQFEAARKKITINEYIQRCAENLGFTPQYP